MARPSGSSLPRVALGRRGKRKTHLTEFKELDIASKFNSLLEQIVNFFIEPSRSKYKPTDEALPTSRKLVVVRLRT